MIVLVLIIMFVFVPLVIGQEKRRKAKFRERKKRFIAIGSQYDDDDDLLDVTANREPPTTRSASSAKSPVAQTHTNHQPTASNPHSLSCAARPVRVLWFSAISPTNLYQHAAPASESSTLTGESHADAAR